MEPSKKKITREQALSAHIECCPYMTAQMGEPISEAGFNADCQMRSGETLLHRE